jgi:hypothetical protein
VIRQEAERLFKALRQADYTKDQNWHIFPSSSVGLYWVENDRPGWTRWVCQHFRTNPIVKIELGEVSLPPGGSPEVPYKLLLKDRTKLEGVLSFEWRPESGRWEGHRGLDWHVRPSPGDTEASPTGNEQAVIERIARTARGSIPGHFANSLDNGLAVLLAKAFPNPKKEELVQATVGSLLEENRNKTGREFSASQRGRLVSAILQTGSFNSALEELTTPGLEGEALVEAGLTGMLSVSGWSSACVLSKSQAEELKRMTKARAGSAEERGVLGIKLERWPVAEVVPGTPAAEAGLRDGDIVMTVDGKDAISAGMLPEQLRLLQGPAGAVAKLTVDRAGKRLSFEVKRASTAVTRTSFKELKPGVWLIKIPTFEGSGIAEKVKDFVERQKFVEGVTFIIDLRDNGGGRPEEANAIADLFLSDKVLQICEFRDGTASRSNPIPVVQTAG